MISIDISCDLHDRDETGYLWAYLDEARDPSLVGAGAIVSPANLMPQRSPRWWI